MSQPFHSTRRVEFRDTDAAGIVHFSVFFTWMEEAEHELLRSLGLSVLWDDPDDTITWPRVAARCDYQGPLKFEETFEIEVRVVRLGDKSVTYDFQFSSQHGPVAAGEMTAVCCRLGSDGALQSIAIPVVLRDKLLPMCGTLPRN